MNARVLKLTLSLASLLAVGVVVFGDYRRVSPGPISRVHAQIEDLDGGNACSQCHGGWFSTMVKSCLECHADIGAQFEAGKGLHGKLAAGPARECSRCHGEHHGEGFSLVNRLAFAQMGVPDVARFDHALVGFAMAGRHLELDCTRCHAQADAEVLLPGQRRYLGLQQDCATCHDDPHQGRMQLACASCHEQAAFTTRRADGHDRHLPLEGAHGGLGCRDCHGEGDGDHALERLGGPRRTAPRACADCHDSPHRPGFVAGIAAASRTTAGAVCAQCHRREHLAFQEAAGQVTPEQHAHSGFALSPPHDRVDCAQCHPLAMSAFGARHPGRKPEHCAACHADVHGGQFASSALARNGCIDCHDRQHWSPPAFGAGQHERTKLPLDGRHAALECRACHRRPHERAPREFTNTPHRCEQCHEDAHLGAFAAFSSELGRNERGSCANCHGTASFEDASGQSFDHGRFTSFALHGAHAQAECTECHRRAHQPDATRRRFGRIAELHGGFHGCVTCHRDPHLGRFDGPHAPAVIDGREGCARCHDTVSFRVLPQGFDHGAFTGFALDGAHGKAACTACHERLPAIDAAGRCWAQARGKECADCHQDPHQGQFERFGRTDCSRCHKSAVNFATLSFRHSLDSRFALGPQHQRVPCAACHKQERINGVLAVRYKPLPTECSACHGASGAPAPPREGR